MHQPHTDENPNNSDLGNCLDYTNQPENNQLPGETNFQRLRSIYLKGEGGALSGTAEEKEAIEQMDAVAVEDTGDGQDNNGRYLRRVILRHYLPAN